MPPSTLLSPRPAQRAGVPRPSRLIPHRLVCRECGADYPAAPTAVCEACLGPLEPRYDPGRRLPTREEIAARAPSLWRYREWLPFPGEPRHSLDTGFTPLFEAPALADRLGVARAWIKNDAVSHPTLSFKDRVVAVAINAAAAFGCETIACASTGNLANAVAAHAARAGLEAWIFVPEDLEPAKISASVVYGARVVRGGGGGAATATRCRAAAGGGRPDAAGAWSTSTCGATTARAPRPSRSRSPSNWAGGSRPRWSRRWGAGRWGRSWGRGLGGCPPRGGGVGPGRGALGPPGG